VTFVLLQMHSLGEPCFTPVLEPLLPFVSGMLQTHYQAAPSLTPARDVGAPDNPHPSCVVSAVTAVRPAL
jgi:hypothetical protein